MLTKKRIIFIIIAVVIIVIISGLSAIQIHKRSEKASRTNEDIYKVQESIEDTEKEEVTVILETQDMDITEPEKDSNVGTVEQILNNKDKPVLDVKSSDGTDILSGMTEEELEDYKSEGHKIIIGDGIDVSYTDSNGKVLPLDPRDDVDIKDGWEFNVSAIQYITLPPIDITYCNLYHFYMNTESVDEGMLEFMTRYLDRSVDQATAEYLSKDEGMRYAYRLQKLEPDQYPEVYPVKSGSHLVELLFYPTFTKKS